MKIGVLSDTHGYLDPLILTLFKGVDHILHGGDIGYPSILLELQDLAPVTAVLGNNDTGLDFKETAVVLLGDRKFLLHHIVDVRKPEERIRKRIIRENPDVVVFGHTHVPFCEKIDQVLYFNPGYAGKPRFGQKRSIALLNCDPSGITVEYLDL